MNINKIALGLSALSVASSIITGIFGAYLASFISLAFILIIWMSWVTLSILRINSNTQIQTKEPISSPPLPYPVDRRYAYDEPIIINKPHNKYLIQSDFFDWEKFTLIFWVNITDNFLNSKNNRYLFAYVSEILPKHEYRNAFFLGIKKVNLKENEVDWRFVVGGQDYSKQITISFNSNQALVGWKLFSIKWLKKDNELKFDIDAGKVFHETQIIPSDYWPHSLKSQSLNIGGWPDWPGGLSYLQFYDIRLFKDLLSDGEIEEMFEYELIKINEF